MWVRVSVSVWVRVGVARAAPCAISPPSAHKAASVSAEARAATRGPKYSHGMSFSTPVARAIDVLGFAFGIAVVASMVRLTFTLGAWPFRLLAAAIAVYVAFRLMQVFQSIRRSGGRRAAA